MGLRGTHSQLAEERHSFATTQTALTVVPTVDSDLPTQLKVLGNMWAFKSVEYCTYILWYSYFYMTSLVFITEEFPMVIIYIMAYPPGNLILILCMRSVIQLNPSCTQAYQKHTISGY